MAHWRATSPRAEKRQDATIIVAFVLGAAALTMIITLVYATGFIG